MEIFSSINSGDLHPPPPPPPRPPSLSSSSSGWNFVRAWAAGVERDAITPARPIDGVGGGASHRGRMIISRSNIDGRNCHFGVVDDDWIVIGC